MLYVLMLMPKENLLLMSDGGSSTFIKDHENILDSGPPDLENAPDFWVWVIF